MSITGNRRAIIEMGFGAYTLDITFAPDADLDDDFHATCNDTGEPLLIHGWLIDSIDYVDEVEA